jgi:hypothetical protein
MNTRIIISQSKSRLLDNLKIAIYHHQNYIDTYIVDIKEIFKAYDIIKPNKICISNQDYESIEIQTLYDQMTETERSKLIVDNDDSRIVNTEIFRQYTVPRNEKTAVILDNMDSVPEKLFNTDKRFSVHMFNNPKIKHTYNLGTLLEHQKAFIFASYKNIIGKNNLYKNESVLCGATYFDIDNLENPITTTDNVLDINDYIKEELYVK